MAAVQETVDHVKSLDVTEYKYGFVTDIESDKAPAGLSEDIVRFISAKKNEPEWLTDWRLDAYRRWQTMREPTWSRVDHAPIPYQELHYYSAPKSTSGPKSLDEVDPELLRTYEKLGIPLREQEVLAGVQGAPALCGGRGIRQRLGGDHLQEAELSEAGRNLLLDVRGRTRHPSGTGEEVPRLGGAGVGQLLRDCLNAAVFSDGSFVYVPPGVRCPMELSTYFRINAEEHRAVRAHPDHRRQGLLRQSYLEGCTAPMRDENQLHAAVVELIALDDAEIKYSTVQNWYPGDAEGKGGIYNFVTKRGRLPGRAVPRCHGPRWRPARRSPGSTRPASCAETNSRGRVLLHRRDEREASRSDTGTKMIHLGRNTTLAGDRQGHLRRALGPRPIEAWCPPTSKASGARNFTQCDSLLIGKQCGGPHGALYRGQDRLSQVRARGDHHEACRKTSCSTAMPARAFRQEEATCSCWSTASCARCCRSCPWNLPSKPRSWWPSRLRGVSGDADTPDSFLNEQCHGPPMLSSPEPARRP